MHPFSCTWKHRKTLKFSDVFRGLEKGCIGSKWVNEKTKFTKKDLPVGNLFPLFLRYWERFIETETLLKLIYHDLSSNSEILFKQLHRFPNKSRINEYCKLLETCKKKKLRTLRNLSQNQISCCRDFDRKWYDIIIDSVFSQLFKRNTKS